VLVFNNVDVNDLQSILNFIYKGDLELKKDQLLERCLQTARWLKVTGLESFGEAADEEINQTVFVKVKLIKLKLPM
jgi:BTB/POZ domain